MGSVEKNEVDENSARIAEVKKLLADAKKNGVRGFLESLRFQSLKRELDDLENSHIPKIDRYSSDLGRADAAKDPAGKGFSYYRRGGNGTIIYDGSFDRLLDILYGEDGLAGLTTGKSGPASFADLYKPRRRGRTMWAIISAAAEKYYGTDKNKQRNGALRRSIFTRGIKVCMLAATIECADGRRIVERYFLAIKPEDMEQERFLEILKNLTPVNGKKAGLIVVSFPPESSHETGEFAVRKDGTEIKTGKKTSAGDIEKIFAAEGNFKFIGVETPACRTAAQRFLENGVCYLTFG